MSSAAILGYVVLFATVGFLFLWGVLCLGGLLRPRKPTPVKLATYECGEASVGTSDLQFDLRFYVVALVFIVFEVELAFFFPWAAVFGQAVRGEMGMKNLESGGAGSFGEAALISQTGSERISPEFVSGQPVSKPQPNPNDPQKPIHRRFVWLAAAELGTFLVVVLLGFFYVWHQGDLDWVRSLESLPGN